MHRQSLKLVFLGEEKCRVSRALHKSNEKQIVCLAYASYSTVEKKGWLLDELTTSTKERSRLDEALKRAEKETSSQERALNATRDVY